MHRPDGFDARAASPCVEPGVELLGFGAKKSRAGAPGYVGLALAHDGFTLCHVVRGDAPQARLEHVHHVSGLTHDERAAALGEYVDQNALASTDCIVVLPAEDYTLRLLDRPQVEESEIASALHWLVKEVIDYDPSDAQIAHCALPEDAQRGRDARIFVGIARKDRVGEIATLVGESGLHLAAIEVAEMALRNLVDELPEQVAGTAMLDLGEKSGLLALCHESQLYFSRTLGTGTGQIDNAIGNEISLDDGPDDDELSHHVRSLLDELLLEIQRSLDYYESELGKAPASRLVIGPSEAEISLYVPYLSEQLRPVRVEQLDLNALVDCDDVLRNDLQTRMLLALGGGLRGEGEQQIDLKPLEAQAPAATDLPFRLVVPACLVLLFAMIGLWALGIQQNAELQARVDAAQERRDTISAQIEALDAQLAESVAATEGVDPLATLKAERDRNARRLRTLETLGGGRREGFSRYLAGFAKRPVEDLWIERIEVHDGGASLSIQGKTLEAKRVPQLLRKLRDEPSFAGKSFSLFELESKEGESVLSFALESEPTDPVSEEAR